MKTLVLFAIAGFIAGCSSEKEIQMGMEDVQLVKIDTVQRYPHSSQQILTWRSTSQVDYIMFVPLEDHYPLGAVMKVMLRK